MLAERIIGNRSRLPLVLLIALRSQILFRRTPTILTTLALSMSVALAASVEMASRSVRTAVNRTADALVGRSDIEVSAGGQGISEDLVEPLRRLDGVERASPSIQQTFRIAEGPGAGEAIRVIGIDFLQESDVRDFAVSEGGLVVSDPLRLVAQPNAILLAKSLADRLGIGEGGTIRLRGPLNTDVFVVRGLLTGELAEAFSGQIAVMDIYAVQPLTGLHRRVHRIDITLTQGADMATVQRAVEATVGGGIAVRPPSMRQDLRHSTMVVIDVSIWALVLIASLLALLSTYAVVSLSVERRLEELALLRIAGMEGPRLSRLIVADAVVFAVVSTALGLAISHFVADPLVGLLSRASENLQRLKIEPLGVRSSTLAVSLLVGLPVAVIASIEPALRVNRGAPFEVLAGQRFAASRSSVRWPLIATSLAFAAIAIAAWTAPKVMTPAIRLAAILGSSILSLGFGTGQLFAVAMPRLRNAFGIVIPRVGHLVAAMLMERTLETGMTVAVWAALVGGVVSMITTVDSITRSMDAYFS
ncbi:MAG TPA: ABC transporter permease, partial [Myxococcota bacterium]|nr:ABC transporter permease [Myxococcota bacterium]